MNHSLWRDNKTQKMYKRYVSSKPKDAPCEFCQLKAGDGQVVKDLNTFWVTKNIFPYTTWDGFIVQEHLMLIPKRHIDSIGIFQDNELIDFGRILAEYESAGYSIYGRAPSNGAKSVTHQHTHLIKLSPQKVNIVLFLRRLGITWFR